MATILTKKKDTTGAPAAGDLTNSAGGAELAVNTADKRLYTKDSGGNVVEVGTNPGAAVTFTAGTVSAPAITTTGDTNTGIFFPAADTIAFAEGGAEAMRITSTGDVGIGATTPNTNSLTLTGKYLIVSDSQSKFGDNGIISGGAADGNTRIEFFSGKYLAFYQSASERMRIDSSGNVGIGTSSPVTKLTVQGDFSIKNTSADNIIQIGDIGSTLRFQGRTSLPLTFWVNDYEYMRLDSSGNLGLGVTPSAFASAQKAFQVLNGSLYADASSAGLQYNSFYNGTNERYIANGYATSYYQASGQHIWRTAASGSAGNAITFTQAMTLDANGTLNIYKNNDDALSIGTASGNSARASIIFRGTNASATSKFGYVGLNVYSTDGSLDISASDTSKFYTGGTERARITSGGYFKASNNGAYANTAGDYHELVSNTSRCFQFRTTTTTGDLDNYIDFSGQTPNNTTSAFLFCTDTTNTKIALYSSGTITNRTGTYNSFSDLKLKQDVVDASSQWNDIKALRIVKYRLKDEVAADPNYPAYIGVIAQEVEQVSPGLVDNCPDFENVTKTREVEKTREVTPAVLDEEGNEVTPAVTETYTETEEYTERVATGTVTKSVKSSIIYMKAVKALQEAMARIETLEAEVAALKAK